MSTLATSKLDLSQPDKFQMASIVTKNSRTGITSNKRLLAIRKGYLYYYSNVPKKFKGDSSILQTIHQLPKCSIQIVNIKQIKGYQSNSAYFSIEFQAKNMLEREDIRKTMTLEEYNFSPKNTKENIVWQFTCDNQFIKQRWVAALEGLHAYYGREKKDIQKFFNQNKSNGDGSEMKSSSSGGRNSQIPWRQSQSFNNKKSNNQVNYLQLISAKSQDKNNPVSLSPDFKKTPSSNNFLQVNQGNKTNMSRNRGNSANQQQGKINNQFNKQYSPPVQSRNPSSAIIQPVIPPSSEQQDINDSINKNYNIQNSPINNLQLSDLKRVSPPKINKSNTYFSKTEKLVISEEAIQQSQNESLRTPAQTPIKKGQSIQFSQNLQQKQADQFQMNILQSQINNIVESSSKSGKGLFQQIEIQSQRQQKNQQQINSHMNMKSSQQFKPKNDGNFEKKRNISNNIFSGFSQQRLPEGTKQIAPIKINKPPSQIQSKSLHSINSQSFYNLHKYIFSKNLSFFQRISIQKNFISKINSFTSIAIKNITEYINSFSIENGRQNNNFEIIYKTNNFTVLNHVPSSTLFKLAFVTSQSLLINGQEKIYFDEEAIKNLKREFKVYNDLEKFLVLGNLKTDSQFRIRVPLTVFMEYKGVAILAIDQEYLSNLQEQNQQDQNEQNQYQTNKMSQIAKIKKQFTKQIDCLTQQGYDLKSFKLTKTKDQQQTHLIVQLLDEYVLNRMCKQQMKKNYLKNLIKIKRSQKHHNLELNPPFTEQLIIKARQSNASTSIQSLQQYISTLTKIQQFKGICPKQQIIEILKICVFCKQIRKLYRSAQGEIQETHFLNLIFKNDLSIMKILNDSGCDQIPNINGVLFTFIKHYLGISCTINQKSITEGSSKLISNNKTDNKLKSADIILSTQINVKIQKFNLDKLQLQQTFESLKKFISQQKIPLAQQALKILQSTYLQQEYQNSSSLYYSLGQQQINQQRKLQLIYLKSSLAYLQHDYLKCIELCKSYEKNIKNKWDPKLFYVYLLMIKSYSHFQQEQFKVVFEKIIRLVQFNYGKNNSIMINLYCIVSYYFSIINKKKQKQSKSYIQTELFSIKLLEQAQILCKKYFGQQSNQYIDILLDLAKKYEIRNRQKSQKYSDRARIIIISTHNYEKHIDLIIHELKQFYADKKLERCEQLIDSAQEVILLNKVKISNSKHIALLKIKFDVGLNSGKNYLCQRAIQALWRMTTQQSKNQAIILASKLLKKLKLISDDRNDNLSLNTTWRQNYSYEQSNSIQNSESFIKNNSQMTDKIAEQLLQGNYSNDEEPILSRIKQMIEDDDKTKEWFINMV